MSTQQDFGRYVTSGDDELDARIIQDAADFPDWSYDAMIAVINYLAAQNIEASWRRRPGAGDDLVLDDGTIITLVPDHDHPQSVGNTFRDGIRHYLMSDRTDPENRYRSLQPEAVTPEQAVSVVADALGRPLPASEQATAITYTNNGVSRRVDLADGLHISEQATDERRHNADWASTTPDDALERLRSVSGHAADRAMAEINVDRINQRIIAAVGMAEGTQNPVTEQDRVISDTVNGVLERMAGGGDAVDEDDRRSMAVAFLRGYELDNAPVSDPTIAAIRSEALDAVEDAITSGGYDPAEPLASTAPDGASGYDRISQIDTIMNPDRMGQGAFRPDLVALYAPGSDFGNSQITENARAWNLGTIMRQAGISPDDFDTGDDRERPSGAVIESMTTVFDPDHPFQPVDETQAGHHRDVMARIRADLAREGISNATAAMDEKGVVMWQGDRQLTYRRRTEPQHVAGLIGQIFLPDRLDAVTTAFMGGDRRNFVIAPGFDANIIPDDGSGRSMLERTRLTGYMQRLNSAIDRTIHADVHAGEYAGSATSLNGVATHIDAIRHPLDFVEDYGGDRPVAEAVLSTEARRVRYPTRLASTSGIMTALREETGDLQPDRRQRTDLMLTGDKDMNVIDDAQPGYFDPVMTTNGDVKQGLVRYLAADARVNEDGSIDPAPAGGRMRAPIHYADPSMPYSNFDPFDRTVMATMNMAHSVGLSQPVGVEQASLGGWTYDDAIVVTDRFADANPVPRNVGGNGRLRHNPDGSVMTDANGDPVRNAPPEMRRSPLTVGDKISDHHGNKGVISKIVHLSDPDERGRAEREGWLPLYDHVAEAARQGKDVFMAPYSAVSRFNGGSAREAMDNGGKVRFIISENTADHKTITYGDDGTSRSNKTGRSASAQLGWSLQAHGCDAIIRELYGTSTGLEEARHYMRTVGMDISPDGTLSDTLGDDVTGQARPVDPDLPWDGSATPMSLPFTLETPVQVGETEPDEGGFTQPIHGAISVLPVMPADLRDRTDLEGDAGPVNYAYDRTYQTIYDAAARYTQLRDALDGDARLKAGEPGADRIPLSEARRQSMQDELDNARAQLEIIGPNVKGRSTYYRNIIDRDGPILAAGWQKREPISASDLDGMRDEMEECRERAQNAYSGMAKQIVERKLTGKHNIFKSGILSNEVPRSATAVWTPDPTLALDTIAVSPTLMRQLGVSDGDPALAWRDPILTTGGVHCFTVKEDPDLVGFAVNPVMDEYFDGDFDGDTLALVGLSDPEAQQEARDKLSLAANLTNPLKYDAASGTYDLAVNTGLDMQVGAAPQNGGGPLKAEYQLLRADANVCDIWDKALDHGLRLNDPEGTREQIRRRREVIVERLSDLVRRTLDNSMGKAVTDFSSVPAHIASVASNCLLTGAKGSPAKLASYAGYLGAEIDQPFLDAMAGYDPDMTPTNDPQLVAQAREAAGHPGRDFTHRMNECVRTLRQAKPAANALPGSYEQAQAMLADPGTHIRDTVQPEVDGTHRRERSQATDAQVSFATATKAYGTGVAGKVSQRAIILTRGTPVMGETLNLSSRATQGTLQIKHDPAKARTVMIALLTGSGPVWNGHAVSWELGDDDAAPSWGPEKGTPTMEEWEESTANFYNSPKGIGAAIDREALHHLAERLSVASRRRDGQRMIDMSLFDPLRDPQHLRVAPIDLLAYGVDARSKLDTVFKLAQAHANVFAGAGAAFMPDDLSRARQASVEAERSVQEGRERRLAGPAADPWSMQVPGSDPAVEPWTARLTAPSLPAAPHSQEAGRDLD